MIKNIIYTLLVLLSASAVVVWMFFADPHVDGHGHDDHGHHAEPEEETAKGPNGGRLLQQDNFALEMKIFEKGVPPEFHIYSYSGGEILDPKEVSLKISLTRHDGQVDLFQFKPQRDYLRGDGEVVEPHSFEVLVNADYQGKHYEWRYDNFEGRVQIEKDIAVEAGIITEKAGPRRIKEILHVTGRAQLDPNRLSQVRARFPGVVKQVNRQLGESIKKGDVLAEIQSNESLQNYTIKAPISGVIVLRNVQVGEATGVAPLFTIANLSKVWIELDVFDKDISRVKNGQVVDIETLSGQSIEGTISWLSPLASHASQSIQARVVVDNKALSFRPGQFVRGRITVGQHTAPLAVRKSGIQGFRDFQVVFARVNDIYEVRMLELGRGDHDWVEVLSGLKPGTEYVTQNSYLIKADIEKSGASHDH